MIVRKYRIEDCRKTAELFKNTINSVNAGDYNEKQRKAWASGCEDLKKWGDSLSAHCTFVAVEPEGVCGETIVGFGDIDGGYLDRLFVHKDHQGKGIASALCDALEQEAKGVIITHSSITAKPFFEKRGYKAVGEQQAVRKGVKLTNFVMEKRREALE